VVALDNIEDRDVVSSVKQLLYNGATKEAIAANNHENVFAWHRWNEERSVSVSGAEKPRSIERHFLICRTRQYHWSHTRRVARDIHVTTSYIHRRCGRFVDSFCTAVIVRQPWNRPLGSADIQLRRRDSLSQISTLKVRGR